MIDYSKQILYILIQLNINIFYIITNKNNFQYINQFKIINYIIILNRNKQSKQFNIYINQNMKKKDICVIGGGIIGSTITRALSNKYPQLKICLIEKENQIGQHTSTRNSSVLHSGLYYIKNSYKAQFCKQGNEQLTKYIIDNNLPLKNTGKFIIANNDEQYQILLELKKQADLNQIEYQWLTFQEAVKIEKYLKDNKQGYNYLFTPTTKVSDSKSVILSFHNDLKQQKNVELILNEEFDNLISQKDYTNLFSLKNSLTGSKQTIESKYIINTAGLYADKIAKQFGFCQKYTILPFKGHYLIHKQTHDDINSLIYPIPPKKGNYFLGVHLTCTIDNKIKFGPSAFPALYREQYGEKGKKITQKEITEFLEILQVYFWNMCSPKASFYLKHAKEELKKIYKPQTIKEALNLFTLFDQKEVNFLGFPKGVYQDFVDGRPGIRAQLINQETRELENDFIIDKDQLSMHLLNVVSPGWTCSLPIADYVCDLIEKQNIF
ncbi:hypothetical protein IMG5_090270 [Ichthyophthirius multifiliis]|uniref:L-2-hydroxyglutarate dehydrogenase, mitochondrial n=1 Tax=Ichthyophthirius multifiliis TaxID=5932 RepID=G0QR81_ICHMU|nr:hypothetical protein IMG5_090270 [Ichthyophthirius multifiliis]EGR32279.1 hypothetical protein IMG5_090270 [Ichthyophthirius multifiliis]|eukprot:XP_004035765.1 hypothetical protein IMG5_090270 [Ichthyophthirius multifiliis]